MSKKKEFCMVCDNDTENVVDVIHILKTYVDSRRFIFKFLEGDLTDQPIEAIKLIDKLKMRKK